MSHTNNNSTQTVWPRLRNITDKEESPGDEDKDKNKSTSLQDLFAKFCSSSTIHGTYFWNAARSPMARIAWGAIVLLGIISATWIINSSFKAWQEHPVITSVMQKSIEEIYFPAITICPLDDTRYTLLCILGNKNF